VSAPARPREPLLALVDVLSCRDNALRRDECGDWRIEGRCGHIYAVPGTLDRPSMPGFQIFIVGSGRWWNGAKRGLAFADLANDGDDEGALFIVRLPTPNEAEAVRHFVGLAKKRVMREAELARLGRTGFRPGGAQTGEKTGSDDTVVSLPPRNRERFLPRFRGAL
jgi:hypothetical protein